jgi:hypothetical protein
MAWRNACTRIRAPSAGPSWRAAAMCGPDMAFLSEFDFQIEISCLNQSLQTRPAAGPSLPQSIVEIPLLLIEPLSTGHKCYAASTLVSAAEVPPIPQRSTVAEFSPSLGGHVLSAPNSIGNSVVAPCLTAGKSWRPVRLPQNRRKPISATASKMRQTMPAQKRMSLPLATCSACGIPGTKRNFWWTDAVR